MKQREIKELHTKTKEELAAMRKELEKSLAEARLEHAQRKLTNTTSLANLRRDYARVLTIMKLKTQGGTE